MRGYFDIETGGKDPHYHRVWVMSIISDGYEPPRTVNLHALQSEQKLITEINDILSGYEEIVSWNGLGFDQPFINFRAMRTGAPKFRHPFHVDLGLTIKRRYNLTYWSMDRVAKSVGLQVNKTPFLEPIWQLAATGDDESWKYIVQHCEADVKVLRGLYHTLILGEYQEVPDAVGTAA